MPDKLFHLYRTTLKVEDIRRKKLNRTFEKVKISVNSNPEIEMYIKIRGNSTLGFSKKNFYLKSVNKFHFKDEFKTKKLFLLSLVNDEFGFKMEYSFRLLGEMGMSFSHRQFAIVYINNKLQGLYLAMERPEDAIKRKVKGAVSVFRATKSQYRGFYSCYKTPGVNALETIRYFNSIHDETDHNLQAEKYRIIIDLDMYMKWLVLNSLLENGDSVDELYIYEVRKDSDKKGILKLFPWDYDGIQSNPAHPAKTHKDPLLWAAERKLDYEIINNPVLYNQLKNIMSSMLKNHLTKEYLSKILLGLEMELNSIDVGNSKNEIADIEQQRMLAIQKFRKRLFLRHDELLGLVRHRNLGSEEPVTVQ